MTTPYTPRKHSATAHIPGLGPPDTMCVQCIFFPREKNRVNGECRKATEFRGGERIADVGPSTAACKYYQKGTIV